MSGYRCWNPGQPFDVLLETDGRGDEEAGHEDDEDALGRLHDDRTEARDDAEVRDAEDPERDQHEQEVSPDSVERGPAGHRLQFLGEDDAVGGERHAPETLDDLRDDRLLDQQDRDPLHQDDDHEPGLDAPERLQREPLFVGRGRERRLVVHFPHREREEDDAEEQRAVTERGQRPRVDHGRRDTEEAVDGCRRADRREVAPERRLGVQPVQPEVQDGVVAEEGRRRGHEDRREEVDDRGAGVAGGVRGEGRERHTCRGDESRTLKYGRNSVRIEPRGPRQRREIESLGAPLVCRALPRPGRDALPGLWQSLRPARRRRARRPLGGRVRRAVSKRACFPLASARETSASISSGTSSANALAGGGSDARTARITASVSPTKGGRPANSA